MIYLDHAATSPLLPEVREAILPWLGPPANPSSAHRAGQRAAAAVDEARRRVAALVGADPAGVVFTSGATEANHLFLRGAAAGGPVAVSPLEHPCVHAAIAAARVETVPLPVGRDGRARLDGLPDAVAVISLMAVNHETGIVQDLAAAREAARDRGARLHVDASQAAGRIPLDRSGIDGLVLSAHKLGGPVGVGALILSDGGPFPPLLGGGSQERGRRGGTVNVAGVVGFGVAADLARKTLAERRRRAERLAAPLRRGLVALGGRLVGDVERAIPHITCVAFDGIPGELVVQALDLRGICVSHGAACASGSRDPSPVLVAMGDPEPEAAVRISLGPDTAPGDVEALLTELRDLLPALSGARTPR